MYFIKTKREYLSFLFGLAASFIIHSISDNENKNIFCQLPKNVFGKTYTIEINGKCIRSDNEELLKIASNYLANQYKKDNKITLAIRHSCSPN